MMPIRNPHPHLVHRSHRAAWLRAAILGVNDGIVSTSSLMLGVLAADAGRGVILTAGIAGLAAGALSMASAEYVSVSSQRDSELADVDIERQSLAANPQLELAELADIHEGRGLEPGLAREVAKQLHAHDAVAAHARDELGIDARTIARPLPAALASLVSFAIGAALPIAAALAVPTADGTAIVAVSLVALAIFGALGAVIGGGSRVRAALRVLIGGGTAMGITALIGHLVGGLI